MVSCLSVLFMEILFMRGLNTKTIFVLLFCLLSSLSCAYAKIFLPAPIYADPIYCGSCDPEIIYNHKLKLWMIFYTSRRPVKGEAATVGNPIGVCVSANLIDWSFWGYCKFDGIGGKPDSRQTRWAPGIIIDGDTAHMYVTFKEDATPPWGTGGSIVHYVAPIVDMLNGWRKVEVSIEEDNCLDACIVKLDNGKFRMYYVGGLNNPETKGRKTIRYAESDDLYLWKPKGNVLGDVNDMSVHNIRYQEAVYVFIYNGNFYMLTDPHKGLSTYTSKDGVTWKYHGQIMETGTSTRILDGTQARHPSVIVYNNIPYIFYHVEPFRPDNVKGSNLEIHQRYAFLQMAELVCDEDGIKRK